MASHANSFSTAKWEHHADLARRQAEQARRLARDFTNDSISRNLTAVADELDEAADELDHRVRVIAALMTPTAH